MRVVFIFLILLSLGLGLYNLTTIPPQLLEREVITGLAASVITRTDITEWLHLFANNFGFINTASVAPLAIVVTAPFIKMFGLTEFGIRLPSVIAGIGTLTIFYFLSREVFAQLQKTSVTHSNKFSPDMLSITAMFLFIFSPWFIQISRVDIGITMGLLFFLVGIYSSLKMGKHRFVVYWWIVPFLAAIYSHYIFVVPVIGALIGTLYFSRKLIKKHKTLFIANILIGILCITPLFSQLVTYTTQIDGTKFYLFTVNEERAKERIFAGGNNLKARILNDQHIDDGKLQLEDVFEYLDPNQLFMKWGYDSMAITPNSGLLFPVEGIVFIFGIYFLLKDNRRYFLMFLVSLGLTLVPLGLISSRPDALRFTPALPLFILTITYGFFRFFESIQKKWRTILVGICVFFLLYFGSRFLYIFFLDSQLTISESQWEYKQAFLYAQNNIDNTKKIIVTDNTYGHDIDLYWVFYTKKIIPIEMVLHKNQQDSLMIDNYTFDIKQPTGYLPNRVYIQSFQTIPKNAQILFSSGTNEKTMIGVFTLSQ